MKTHILGTSAVEKLFYYYTRVHCSFQTQHNINRFYLQAGLFFK